MFACMEALGMNRKPHKKLLLAGTCLLMVLLLSACGEWQTVKEGNTTADTPIQVDPLLQQDYEQQGGSAQFGAVTSVLVNENGKQCQFTTLGMICFDSQASEGSRFSFTPVVSEMQFSTPFQRVLDRLGGIAIFGSPLGEPVRTPDGFMEQVYENAVIYAPVDNPNAIALRPLAKILNMPMHQPVLKKYDRRDNVIFYPVQGELGFHVPIVFDEFIASHGGTETSGQPISETDVVEIGGERIARQCFENYCLDYYPSAQIGAQVRMAQLGYRYEQTPVGAIPAPALEPVDPLAILISEDKAQVLDNETQTFFLLVYNDHTKEPRPNANATLLVMFPDGASYSYEFPPTGINGWTRLEVPPLPEYQHGTLVAYKICLSGEPQTCVSESYLVWNYR
jgi:hypothetical protein